MSRRDAELPRRVDLLGYTGLFGLGLGLSVAFLALLLPMRGAADPDGHTGPDSAAQ